MLAVATRRIAAAGLPRQRVAAFGTVTTETTAAMLDQSGGRTPSALRAVDMAVDMQVERQRAQPQHPGELRDRPGHA
jgi:hypothetical protein